MIMLASVVLGFKLQLNYFYPWIAVRNDSLKESNQWQLWHTDNKRNAPSWWWPISRGKSDLAACLCCFSFILDFFSLTQRYFLALHFTNRSAKSDFSPDLQGGKRGQWWCWLLVGGLRQHQELCPGEESHTNETRGEGIEQLLKTSFLQAYNKDKDKLTLVSGLWQRQDKLTLFAGL